MFWGRSHPNAVQPQTRPPLDRQSRCFAIRCRAGRSRVGNPRHVRSFAPWARFARQGERRPGPRSGHADVCLSASPEVAKAERTLRWEPASWYTCFAPFRTAKGEGAVSRFRDFAPACANSWKPFRLADTPWGGRSKLPRVLFRWMLLFPTVCVDTRKYFFAAREKIAARRSSAIANLA